MAYNSSNATNVQLGTCAVTFGQTDLGLTKGGVSIQVKTDTHKVTVDQFGQTDINEYIMGRSCMVSVPMAETDLDKLALVVPGSVIVADHLVPSNRKLVSQSGVSLSLLSLALPLNCHPIALVGDKSQDFTLLNCSPKGEFDFAYKLDEERIYTVEFTAYVEFGSNELFVIGDNTPSSNGAVDFSNVNNSGLLTTLFH